MKMDESTARTMLGETFAMRLPLAWKTLDLRRFPIANYIVFRDGLESTLEASKQKIKESKAILRAHGIAPLFMMDEEGGRVTQVSDFFPTVPSPRAVSSALLPEEIGVLYDHVSHLMAELGIDINLAPCLDVNTESMNPIIGTRSFGRIPKTVSLYALTSVLASRPHLALVGKHFPGHGMTEVDSHLDLPVVEESEQGMESIHLKPFIEAAGVGIDGLMVSHCTYTSLQSDKLPASLSRQIVGSLLRKKIGFGRLVITDSLDMDAVTRTIEPERAPMLAHQAGCDILLYTKYSRRFEDAFEALVGAVVSGQIPQERLAASLSRRAALIHRLRLSRHRPALTGRETYLALREKVLTKSVTVRDPRRLLPVEGRRVALVSTHPEIRARLRSHVPSVSEACAPPAPEPGTPPEREIGAPPEARAPSESGSHAPSDQNGAVLLLWLMEPFKLTYALECMAELVERSRPSILVTSYQPLMKLLPGCDISILTHDTSPQTCERILQMIFGKRPV